MDKEEENKICINCGKCCMCYWIFTDIPEEIERFETLSKTFIKVEKIKEKLWKVLFLLDCQHLKHNPNGTVECMIYNEKRPQYCYDYPRNFLHKDESKEVLDNEIEFCPLLKKLNR